MPFSAQQNGLCEELFCYFFSNQIVLRAASEIIPKNRPIILNNGIDFDLKMPERVVVLGEGLYFNLPEKEQEQFGLFDRYKDTWVAEQCEALGVDDDDDFRDDLFRSLDDLLEFWGTEDTCDAVGSIYARRYKDFTDEDEKFYQQLVEKTDEAKSQIKILKPQSPEARNVKIRCQRDWRNIAKRMS